MNIRPFRQIERRKSRKIKLGNIFVGGDAPITVQTMTNTLTSDINATLEQINSSVEAGADIIRVSCPDEVGAIEWRYTANQVSNKAPCASESRRCTSGGASKAS